MHESVYQILSQCVTLVTKASHIFVGYWSQKYTICLLEKIKINGNTQIKAPQKGILNSESDCFLSTHKTLNAWMFPETIIPTC